jgi:hypothetical protein
MSTLKTCATYVALFIFTFMTLSGVSAAPSRPFETVFLSSSAGAGLFAMQGNASAVAGTPLMASVEPVFVAGNPSCVDLGYEAGFKIEPVNSGTYTITGTGHTVTITVNGSYFDWTSTIGMDAVIVKGGPNANVYIYNPPAPSLGDTGLHSPINSSNGNPYGLSHLEFCYSPALTITKTANATYTRTYDWDIDKTVDDDTLDMFRGDSGTVNYTVTVTKDAGTDSDFAADGTITVTNNSGFPATVTGVTDSIDGIAGPIPVDCPVSFPYVLANGASFVCTYDAGLPDAQDRVNTATVTTDPQGVVNGGTATAAVDFGAPTTVLNDSINVTDTYAGSLGSASDDKTYNYSRTFTCDGDGGNHGNTASFTAVAPGSDSGSDSASVLVTCYALGVSKTANGTFGRSWTWDIQKTADQTNIGPIQIGQPVAVNYQVTVTGSYTDGSYAVSGAITVNNPAPIAATINSVTDVISGVGSAPVDCGVSFPYSLAAGGTLNCTYSSALPDGAARTNTATVTLQNTPSGTTNFSSGAVNIVFPSTPGAEVDECVNVVDDYGTPNDPSDDLDFGTFCATTGDKTKTFTYSRTFQFEVCETYTFTNTARLTTNDTETTDSDDHTVIISVICPDVGGCTLTPGYWKTHAKSLFVSGPPYDPTWDEFKFAPTDQIHNNFDAFYLSGKNYIEVLWTAPAGNVYYNLSFHYIAAQLNILAGADGSLIEADMVRAAEIFSTYTPAQIGALKGNNALRQEIIAIAGRLGQFNEGSLSGGPEHCDLSATPF